MLKETTVVNQLITDCYENGLHYKTEVPLFRSKIDLVTINPKNNKVIAIEAKVSNWYRALQQATSYTMCANKVYVALWHKYQHRVDPEIFRRYGIGLLSVDETIDEVIPPKESKEINRHLMKEVRGFVLPPT